VSWFAIGSWIAYALVVLLTLRLRGRIFATFLGVGLGLFTLIALALRETITRHFGHLPDYLHVCVYAHFTAYLWPRMRSLAWHVLLTYPASFFLSGTLLAWPWALLAAFGVTPYLWFLPYALSLLGLVQSFYTRESEVALALDDEDVGALRRFRAKPPRASFDAPSLSIVQLTDTHIGPFMSVKRLERICTRAVERDPDLILLTGDFLTVDSNHDQTALRRALAPLAAARGRVFACLGNHDHEAPRVVRQALSEAGVRLLVDEAVLVDTKLGPVHLLGFDFHYRGRKARIADVFARNPRPEGALRIVLMHDPGAFARVPEGEGDLVLSGHTHGGQVGLVSFGLPWTFVSLVTKLPDHGFWARGKDRLYVHRGTGHYGFPLRVGVPAEQSLMRVFRSGAT
jgi:predicted MPP superfamily phosphohydrolase